MESDKRITNSPLQFHRQYVMPQSSHWNNFATQLTRLFLCLTKGSQVLTDSSLLRWSIHSHRLHTPYAQSHSLEHPPVSSLHNLLTDQWECPVNKTAFVRPHCRASWLMLCLPALSQRHQQNTVHHKALPKQRQPSWSWFQQLFPSCKHKHYKCTSAYRGITTPHPSHSLPVAHEYYPSKDRRAYNLSLEDSHLWVVLKCASVRQFPLITGSSPISIKLIIFIKWMIPQKTRFLSLQPQ